MGGGSPPPNTEEIIMEKLSKASMLRKALPYAATAIGAGAVAGGAGYAAGAGTERKKGTRKARKAFRFGARYGRMRGHREAARYYSKMKKGD